MNIKFTGKYKSIVDFSWIDIPSFVVITGTNGTGKSQLLQLIYNTIINKINTIERVVIEGKSFSANEVTYIAGEWRLDPPHIVNLASVQQQQSSLYNHFQQNKFHENDEGNLRLFSAFKDVLRKSGKKYPNEVTQDEFNKYFPELLIENEFYMGRKIAEIFYNYRLEEIDLQAQRKSETEIRNELGEPPWIVLRKIIEESKLPFEINDPSGNRIKDDFHLRLTHSISNEEIDFYDLSSGEKVLLSLVF